MSQQTYRKDETEFKDHVNICGEWIITFPSNTNTECSFLETFSSYITGLAYHAGKESPEKHKMYVCEPEINSRFPKAMGVYCDGDRFGYVPKELAHELYDKYFANNIPVLCVAYCKGGTTPRSSQCYYNVFKLDVKHSIEGDYVNKQVANLNVVESVPIVERTSGTCVRCNTYQLDNRLIPCGHIIGCSSCINGFNVKQCTVCGATIQNLYPLQI